MKDSSESIFESGRYEIFVREIDIYLHDGLNTMIACDKTGARMHDQKISSNAHGGVKLRIKRIDTIFAIMDDPNEDGEAGLYLF